MKPRRAAGWSIMVLVVSVWCQGVSASEIPRFRGVPVMPGGQVVGGQVVYEGGAVIVVPAGSGSESFDSCPAGKVCLFQDANWAGNMVQFSTCCAWDNLANYGFNNMASSWRNRLGVDAQIADGAGGGNPRLCLNSGSFASSMPAGWNDAATSIRVRDAATYC
jgi:Peptidase inhibitor family I36